MLRFSFSFSFYRFESLLLFDRSFLFFSFLFFKGKFEESSKIRIDAI